MGFDTLLGNEQLKQNLTAARDRDRFSHFYLICGPEGSGRHTLADLLAAAMLCTGADAPCGVCPSCRKVLSHSHPDYVTVDDPEKATVPVELIRQARADVFVRPNEGRRKIYLFPRAQDMGIPGQNALLKVLEEPPEYGAFLLLTDNPNKLLPTVRSRCVELKLRPLPPQTLGRRLRQEFSDADDGSVDAAIGRSGGYLGQARRLLAGEQTTAETQGFCKAYGSRDPLALVGLLTPMEKWKRDALIPELERWLELVERALLCRTGGAADADAVKKLAAGRSGSELMAAVDALRKAVEYARGNVSCAAVCGWLSWALR